MKVAFLGATKGMGRALARLMAERGDRLFLLGRDKADLERSARDLEVRGRPESPGPASDKPGLVDSLPVQVPPGLRFA